MKPLAAIARRLPTRLLYPASAWFYRARPETHVLLLDDLVDADRPAVDVGAWWGPWTYWLARRCPEVIAVEPNPVMAEHLARVAPDNVRVEALALSDDDGEGALWVPDGRGRDALASLDGDDDGHGEFVSVPLRRLDDLGLDDVGFLKVDVEGHEFAVLRGAAETLRRCRPVILVELEEVRATTPMGETIDYLAGLGYEGWIRREGRWASIDTFDLDTDQRAHAHDPMSVRYINNFVFVREGSGPPAPP